MGTLCGADCSKCGMAKECKGCEATCGSPFGGKCVAAEYIKAGGMDSFIEFKKQLCAEFNALKIAGMPGVTDLFCLTGAYVNLEYPLPSGGNVKLLNDKDIYLGNQLECEFDENGECDRCYGIVAGMDFLLVCEYGCEGTDPEIVLFARR